jgi:sugar-specific transcriptional regulator TrmB
LFEKQRDISEGSVDNYSTDHNSYPSTNSIVTHLQAFGLTEKEARLYFVLSKLGSATASQVGAVAKLNRLQTYRSMKVLLDKGLVEISLKRPRKYAPLKIEQALSLLRQEAEQKILELERKEPILLEAWAQSPDIHAFQNNYSFRVIQGKDNVFKFTLMLLESAKEEILTVMKGDDLMKWVTQGADDILQKMARKNILLKSIAHVNERNEQASRRFLEFSGLRHTLQSSIVPMVIIDKSEILISLSSEEFLETSPENAIWTNHPEFVGMLKGFFQTLWDNAQDGQSRISDLQRIRI